MASAATQGELWGIAAADWALLQEPKHLPLFEAMLNATAVTDGTRFIDLGCGGGTASELAAARGAQISGLDAAEKLIEIARQRVPSGDFRVGDLESLPFADQSFDVVFAASSVQYAENRVAALREFGRVCASDGQVVIALFGAPENVQFRAIFKAIREAMPVPPPGDGPFELSMPGKLEGLVEQAGLNLLSSGEANCPFVYPDFDAFWRANAAAGPFQGAIRVIGEDKLKGVLRNAVEPFTMNDGSVNIAPNGFKYLVASP